MYIRKPLRITKGNDSHGNGPSSLLFIIIICPVDMNVYAKFDEIPSITPKDIKKTKRYGRTDARTDVPTFIFFLSILHVNKVSNNTKSTQQYPRLLRIKSYFQRF